MVVVLYATYLYSSPDRRPATTPVDSPVEYRRPNVDEERGIVEDEQAPALEDYSEEKRA
jgi:hypothetical protein